MGWEQIIDVVWPELDLERGMSRLHRVVSELRELLGDPRLLTMEIGVVAIAPQEQVWLDADAFEQLLEYAHACDDLTERQGTLEQAAALYTGRVLPEIEVGIEEVAARREACERMWIGLLLELADVRAAQAWSSFRLSVEGVLEPLYRVLSCDPTNEAAARRLLLLLQREGRRGEALRVYERLAAHLQGTYQIEPLPKIRAIHHAVLVGSTPPEQLYADLLPQAIDRNRRVLPLPEQDLHGAGPFVGRERELTLLRRSITRFERMTFGVLGRLFRKLPTLFARTEPQCFLLIGEIGVGKTRLAEEIAREAEQRRWIVARVHAQRLEHTPSYSLWSDVLRSLFEGIVAHGLERWLWQEVKKQPMLYQPLCALLPELLPLLSHPLALARREPLPAEQEGARILDASLRWLRLVCLHASVLIVLDSLEHADHASCELVATLGRRLEGITLLMLGTCCEQDLDTDHPLRYQAPDLQRFSLLHVLRLSPLSDEQVHHLLTSQLGPAVAQHAQEIAPLVQEAQGNPLFAHQLAESWQRMQNEGRRGSDRQGLLPKEMTLVFDLCLARLSHPSQRLVGQAALLGVTFTFSALAALEARTSGASLETILHLLEEALRAGLLTEEGSGASITYRFWHPLLVRYLAQSHSAARRARLEQAAREALALSTASGWELIGMEQGQSEKGQDW